MNRHLPLLPCLLGLALCVWRPEWVSVAVLALLLCFALYLDNRGRRADDVEDLHERIDRAESAMAATIEAVNNNATKQRDATTQAASAFDAFGGTLGTLQREVVKLKSDVEAVRVALAQRPGRPQL